MAITLTWLGHASFRIVAGETVIYIDPWKLKSPARDADFILVSHSHFDHYSAPDIKAISKAGTQVIGSADVIKPYGGGKVITPGQTLDLGRLTLTGVPAYNPAKPFHPQANHWLGFVIAIDGKRIYYAGDTDATAEMKALEDIELALLPVGGTYTMNAAEAAEAVNTFKPARAVPYHWGDIVGDEADAKKFAQLSRAPTTILAPGQSLTLASP
ncbi:MAG TPA: MBL fold metallo-hydrolase [Phycisphaerales bacterium]|nr:MBL fold metallo-hydrolase [Phycisphaerales bacterium]